MLGNEIHKQIHKFCLIEIPECTNGITIHRVRCLNCKQYPIYGLCFSCEECSTNYCKYKNFLSYKF